MENQETRRLSKESELTRRISNESGSEIFNFTGMTINGRFEISEINHEARGGEADIYFGRDIQNNKRVILKFYRHGLTPKQKVVEKIMKLNHKNLLQILEIGTESGRFFEVQDFAEGGSVSNFLPLTENQIRDIIHCVTEAINLLHNNDLVHRDIKPSNILYSDKTFSNVVLSDYGISTIFDHTEILSYRKTERADKTFGYSAPETYNSFVTLESDYYSLGISLIELITGVYPFAGMSDSEIMFKTISGIIDIPENISPNLRALIKGLLIKEKNLRFKYEDIQKFLKGEKLTIPEIQHTVETDIRKQKLKGGFKFGENPRVNSIEELILEMRKDSQNSIKFLRRMTISSFIKNNGDIEGMMDMANELDDLIDEEKDDEKMYIKALYKLQGKPMFLSVFPNIAELSKYIQTHQFDFQKALFE